MTNPHAFFSIEDVRYVNEGVFRPKKTNQITGLLNHFSAGKKEISLFSQNLTNRFPFTDSPYRICKTLS